MQQKERKELEEQYFDLHIEINILVESELQCIKDVKEKSSINTADWVRIQFEKHKQINIIIDKKLKTRKWIQNELEYNHNYFIEKKPGKWSMETNPISIITKRKKEIVSTLKNKKITENSSSESSSGEEEIKN